MDLQIWSMKRLRILKLPSLRYRRYRGDMIECWKHFNDYDSSGLSSSLKSSSRPSRQHQYQFQLPSLVGPWRKVIEQNFFYRAAHLWNKLPSEVVAAKTLETFGKGIDKHWYKADFKLKWWLGPPELREEDQES